MGADRLKRYGVTAHGLGSNVHKADRSGPVHSCYLAPAEYNLTGRTAEHFGRNGTDFFLQLQAGLFDRASRDVSGRGGVGAGIVRGSVGIGAKNGHVIHRAIHALGRHLRQYRITSRTHIGRADAEHVETVVIELDGGRADVNA